MNGPETVRLGTPAEAGARGRAMAGAVRPFGRYQLLRLLGKSERTMAWLGIDTRTDQDVVLVLPRRQPEQADVLRRWIDQVQRAARIKHPGLAHAIEIGEQERWPFVAYDRANGVTLAERLGAKGLPALEIAKWGSAALEGLAFAHEAGVVHRDPQPYLLIFTEQGHARVMGLEAALGQLGADAAPSTNPGFVPYWQGSESMHTAAGLQAQRKAAERDVLAFGLILHQAAAGQPALEQADIAQAIALMPPAGRETVRLPWNLAQPLPEALRTIINRATDRQQRQRYRNARTLARALQGWLTAETAGSNGPLALLLDRLRTVGLLPSLPGAAANAAHLALLERERTIELAENILQDPALSFEILRAVNVAAVRGTRLAGSGPVLTVRRALAMIGLDGVRRAALALREWPGPLNGAAAAELERLMNRAKQAARLAQTIRPMGYDAELVYLVTLLQNLGRMVAQYHFAEEAAQIRRLMQTAEPESGDEAGQPGMSEQAASFAVLGIDTEALGLAVAKHWGFDDAVLQMIRRQPVAAPVHRADDDSAAVRLTASCANELIEALDVPAAKLPAALQRVVVRYGRVLDLSLRDVQVALGLAQRDSRPIVPSEDEVDSAAGAGQGERAWPTAPPPQVRP